jgi:hypothetical protein
VQPRVGVQTPFIEPGSPWENGYVESFIGRLQDEFLNGEILYTLKEAKGPMERWRQEYNRMRPHSAPGYRPPASVAIEPRTGISASQGLQLLGALPQGVALTWVAGHWPRPHSTNWTDLRESGQLRNGRQRRCAPDREVVHHRVYLLLRSYTLF